MPHFDMFRRSKKDGGGGHRGAASADAASPPPASHFPSSSQDVSSADDSGLDPRLARLADRAPDMDGIAFVRAVEESLFSASRLTPTEIRALVRERVSPDCVCRGITWDAKEEVKGPDQLFERALGLQHAFPQCHLKFRSAFGRLVGRGQDKGYTICLTWSWFGQHTDEGQHLEGMRGTERRVRLEGTSIFRLRLKDIRIVEYTRYWPTASFLEQLGLSVEYPAAGFTDYVASKIDAVGGRARAAVNVVSSTMGLGAVVEPAQSPAGQLEAEETAPARERRAAERRALSIVRQQEGPAVAANMAAGSPPATAGTASPAVTSEQAAGTSTTRGKRWLRGLSSKLRPSHWAHRNKAPTGPSTLTRSEAAPSAPPFPSRTGASAAEFTPTPAVSAAQAAPALGLASVEELSEPLAPTVWLPDIQAARLAVQPSEPAAVGAALQQLPWLAQHGYTVPASSADATAGQGLAAQQPPSTTAQCVIAQPGSLDGQRTQLSQPPVPPAGERQQPEDHRGPAVTGQPGHSDHQAASVPIKPDVVAGPPSMGLARQRSRSFALFRQINAQRDVQEEERLKALPLLSAERRQHLAGLE